MSARELWEERKRLREKGIKNKEKSKKEEPTYWEIGLIPKYWAN